MNGDRDQNNVEMNVPDDSSYNIELDVPDDFSDDSNWDAETLVLPNIWDLYDQMQETANKQPNKT
eukprot:4688782-Ditylum_brightwellii.AAC.1